MFYILIYSFQQHYYTTKTFRGVLKRIASECNFQRLCIDIITTCSFQSTNAATFNCDAAPINDLLSCHVRKNHSTHTHKQAWVQRGQDECELNCHFSPRWQLLELATANFLASFDEIEFIVLNTTMLCCCSCCLRHVGSI